MAKAFVLYNPIAGSGQSEDTLKKLQEILTDEYVFCDMTKTEAYEDSIASMSSDDYVIVCGGDGTLNRFANKIQVSDIENDILYFPCGSGNDFARELGKENKFLKISESGYISTNLIGYEYVFYIGKEAVADFLKNSYNITFEQINEIYYATMKTTEPYTANTTTTPAKAPDDVAYGTTTVTSASNPNDPMWWCGTEME